MTSVAILGGCFPVQEQIKPEMLYHNLIKDRILKEKQTEIKFSIYRYDTFRQCLELLKTIEEKRVSCVLFHVRPDPFLSASKMYVKFIDYNNKKRRSINLHLFGFKEPEIKPVNFGTNNYRGALLKFIYYTKKQTRRILRNVNYTIGFFICNNLITKKKLLKTINKIKIFCDENKIKLIVQGPPMRPRSIVENLLLYNLDKYLGKSLNKNIVYIHSFNNKDDSGKFIFLNDKIHLNENGHRFYANLLYHSIINY